MIISKSVPMEISRKKFSNFDKKMTPEEMIFVGYQYDLSDPETDLQKKKKKNVQLHYNYLLESIKKWIEENGGFGGSGTVTPPSDEEWGDDEIYKPVVVNEPQYYPLTTVEDVELGMPFTYDEKTQTHVVPLNKKKGFLEINGGGDYVEEYVYLDNPQIGTITSIVIDNTGKNHEEGDPEEEWKPKQEFRFYYGYKTSGNAVEVLCVPVGCRGIIQVLHSRETDVIINASYTDALLDEQGQSLYIADVIPAAEEDENDEPVQGEMLQNGGKVYVDMKDEQGYIEVQCEQNVHEYTFVFENTELGSTTYIVVDNINGTNTVIVNYGKVMAEGEDDIENNITDVQVGEKCVIQVFHSLSVDIVCNITKI